MTIGILGAGGIGRALARHFVRADYEVILANRRGPESLTSLVKELGPKARTGSAAEAAAAPIVVLSVKWKDIPDAVVGLGSFAGRIVIDTSNPYVFGPKGEVIVVDLGGRSSSEIVAEHVAGARLVKAFNNLLVDVLARDPHEAGGRRVVFFSGDDAEAKNEVKGIAAKIGFAPVDLGSLAIGGRVQQGRGPFSAKNFVLVD